MVRSLIFAALVALGSAQLAAAQDVAPAAADDDEAPPRCDKNPHDQHFTLSLGFSHWYGETFGAPIGISTPGLTFGWIPLSWLELQLAYSISLRELDLPTGEQGRVGFGTLAVLLRSALQVGGERLVLAGGVIGGVVHTRNGMGGAVGGALVARYVLQVNAGLAVGPFLDVRALLYTMQESDLPLYRFEDGFATAGHSDAQIQIGVAFAF